MEIQAEENRKYVRGWWESRRRKYNIGLILAGILAFFAYAVVGQIFILPYDKDFEITLLTISFQGIGYLFMIMIANVIYGLGYAVDIRFNQENQDLYRQRLFKLGYRFSVGLPFIIPVILFIEYLLLYSPLKK